MLCHLWQRWCRSLTTRTQYIFGYQFIIKLRLSLRDLLESHKRRETSQSLKIALSGSSSSKENRRNFTQGLGASGLHLQRTWRLSLLRKSRYRTEGVCANTWIWVFHFLWIITLGWLYIHLNVICWDLLRIG